MYLDVFKSRVVDLNFGKRRKPASQQEIDSLELKLEFSLPEAYKEFLLWGGKDPGEIWSGSVCAIAEVADIQDSAIELLDENNFPLSLPNNAFVFLMHQGYQIMFFEISNEENPPVYFYSEGQEDKHFQKLYDSFSECLIQELNFQLEVRESLGEDLEKWLEAHQSEE